MNFIWSFLAASPGSGIPDQLLDSNQSWDKVISFLTGGDDNSSVQNADVVHYYQNWDQYLETKKLIFVQIEGTLNNWITKGLYHVAHSLEDTFNAVLKLFGIFGDLNSGDAGGLYKIVVTLAFILLTMGLSFIFLEMMLKAKTKLHDIIQSMIVTIAVCIMLPFGINLFGQFVLHGSEMLENGYSSSKQTSSITMTPIRNNVVDVLMLTKDKFNTDPKTIGETKNPAKNYNGITNSSIDHVDFGEVIAEDNLKTIPGIDKDPVLKSVDNVFKHQLKLGTNDKDGKYNYYIDDATLPKKQSSITKSLSPVRARYHGHWVLIDLLLVTIAGLFAFIAFRVGKSWYEIFMLNMVAPLMALQDLHGNQRIKEILMAIQGSFISVFTEVIGIRVFMIVIQYLSTPNNPALTFLGKQQNPAMSITFFTIIMYIACFMALLNGVNLIERWTGVPQGHHDGLAGFMMGTGALMKGAGFFGNKAKEGASTILGKDNGILRDDSLPTQRRNAALNNPANSNENNSDINHDSNNTGNGSNSNESRLNDNQEESSPNEFKDSSQEQESQEENNPTEFNDEGSNNEGENKLKNQEDSDSGIDNRSENIKNDPEIYDDELGDNGKYDKDPAIDISDTELDDANADEESVPNPAEGGTNVSSQDTENGIRDDDTTVVPNPSNNSSLQGKNNQNGNEVLNGVENGGKEPTNSGLRRVDNQRGLQNPDPTEIGNQGQESRNYYNDGRVDLPLSDGSEKPEIATRSSQNDGINSNGNQSISKTRKQEKSGKKISNKPNILNQAGNDLENLARKDQSLGHSSMVNPPDIEVDDSIY